MLRKKRYIKITLQITSNMFYGFVSHESIKLRTILQKKNDIYFGNFFCRNTCNTCCFYIWLLILDSCTDQIIEF